MARYLASKEDFENLFMSTYNLKSKKEMETMDINKK